jgi:hypothetical protein
MPQHQSSQRRHPCATSIGCIEGSVTVLPMATVLPVTVHASTVEPWPEKMGLGGIP